MRSSIDWRRLLHLPMANLRRKIITWSFIPTMIILVSVAVVIYFAYQDVTEDLVIGRNRELIRLTANQLVTKFKQYADVLEIETRRSDIYGANPDAQRDALRRVSNRLTMFDAGVVILDTFGTVVASEPDRPELLNQDWADHAIYLEMLQSMILGAQSPLFSKIVPDGPNGTEVIVVSAPILGPQGEFVGLIGGMFEIHPSALSSFYGDIIKLRIGETGTAYIVDNNGQVIYHTDHERILEDRSNQDIVEDVLTGKVNAIRTRDVDGLEIVASFAPIPGTPWGLIKEESWTELISASQGYRRSLFLLLALGVAAPALVVSVGVRRITKPVRELINAARDVADGNFGQIITAETGDEIEELAEQFNLMSAQLQASYAVLEQRVADRTKELKTLNEIAAVVSQSLDLQEILDNALRKTLELMHIDAGGIYLLDEDADLLRITNQVGFDQEMLTEIDNLKVGEGFSGRVVQDGQSIIVDRIEEDPRLTRSIVRERGFNTVAIFPLVSRRKVYGTLFVISKSVREFTDQERELLRSIGGQIGAAVGNARLFAEVEQRMQELSALYHADEEMYRFLAPEMVLQALVDVAVDILQADKSSVIVWEKERERLVMQVARGFSREAMERLTFGPGEGITWDVATLGTLATVEDAETDPRRAEEGAEQVQAILAEGIRSFMHLPIQIEEEVVGVFNVSYTEPYAFAEDDVRLFQALAKRAALAIHNANLFEAEQRRAEQFRVINEVGAQISSILNVDELLIRMASLIRDAFDYYHVGFGLVEGDEVVYKAGSGELWEQDHFEFQPGRLKIGEEGISGWVAATGEPKLIQDVSQEPRYVEMQGSKTKSELTLPIKARGKVLGILDVQSDHLNAFDPSDLSVLQTLAHQAGVAIENATLFEAQQRRADQFRLIHEMGSRMTSILELDELLEQVVEVVQKAFDYYLVEIGLVEGDQLVYKSRAGIGWDPPFESFSLKVGDEGITGWVAATGEPVLVPDVDQDPRYQRVTETSSRSELAVPIKVKEKVTGVINVESDLVDMFDESDLEVLQLISNQAAIAIENARLYEQAQLMAAMEERNRLARDLHDAVTQTLFSASLIAETLPTLWERDHDEGEELLKELRQLNRGALAEMRTLLMELRPAALVDASLEELLRQLGDAITGRTGMQVTILVEGHLELPSDVHVALYRIAQEALNNAVKHAEAKKVQVQLRYTSPGEGMSARVEVNIIDDGIGFDLRQVQPECLGLGIMQERAKTIGAELAVKSEAGEGTEVMVHWKDEGGL